MGLKSPLWYLSSALSEERKRSKLSHLGSRALDLGLGKVEKTRGHVFQSIGAVQQFYDAFPAHKVAAKAASPFEGYKPSGQFKSDWNQFILARNGAYGRALFGYDYTKLKNIITPKYGGTRTGGGGADNELELAFRLVAEFH